MGIWISGGLGTEGTGPTPYTPPSWSEGTDDEIVMALSLHYQDIIDLTEYWSVGDERIIHVNNMNGVSSNSISNQDIVMVLMNVGGKELVTPINGHTECAFIVGQKNVLSSSTSRPQGEFQPMGASAPGSWSDSGVRDWCNNTYRNSFPESIRYIFKQHINYSASKAGSSGVTSVATNDYFALAISKEIASASGYSGVENSLKRFTYYDTTANRYKYDISGSQATYWTRSIQCASNSSSYSKYWLTASNGGVTYSTGSSGAQNWGISPFGVI